MEANQHYHASAQFHQHDRSFVEVEYGAPRTVQFSAPPEFGGEPGFWTPEHFLLAAIASCFVETFKAIARVSKMEFQGIEVNADGLVEKEAGGFRFTEIHLRPVLIIYEEHAQDLATRILEKAERACLVSRSLSSRIVMQPKVLVERPVVI